MSKRLALLGLAFVSGLGTVYGAPTITGLTGVFDHRSTVTITGESFGIHPDFGGASHAIPNHLADVWKDFEDGLIESDGLTVENGHTSNWLSETTAAKAGSAAHGRRIFADIPGTDLERVSGLQRSQAGTTGKWFFSHWFRIPSLAEGVAYISGGKPFRVYGDSISKNIYSSILQNQSTGAIYSECGGNCSPVPTQPQRAGMYKLGEWQRIDVVMTQDPDQLILYRNMEKFWCKASSTSTFTNCLYPYREQHVYNPFNGDGHTYIFGHMINGPPDGSPLGSYYRFDDIYATFSLAHVELCNKSTWNALITGGGTSANKCEVQPPITWTDTGIQISFNAGSFATGETAYLYVVTDGGTAESFDVNANGFPIAIGATGSGASGMGEDPTSDASVTGVLVGYDIPDAP